jgi:hypothetical protein
MTDDSKQKDLKDLLKELPSIADINRIYAEVQLADDYAAAMRSHRKYKCLMQWV